MLSRIAFQWNHSIAVGLRNCNKFHQTTSWMCEKANENIESIEHRSADTKNGSDSMIKSATNSMELLDGISKSVRDFSVQQTLAALKKLVQFQKHESTSISYGTIVRNRDFESLCHSLRKNTEHLRLDDAIEALKIFAYVDVTTTRSKEARAMLLKRIKSQINDATLSNLLFLSFLLRQMKSSNLVDSLQMLLPELVKLQVSKNLDHLNMTQFIELFNYITHYRLSDLCTANILNGLERNLPHLNPEHAKNLLWSLSSPKLYIHNEFRDALLGTTINMLEQNLDLFDFDTVLTTLGKMVNAYLDDTVDCAPFYNEKFYHQCAEYVVTKDLGFEQAIFIQRRLNRVGFVNNDLLKYILEKIEKDPQLIVNCKAISFISLVTTLSQANVKPANWDYIRELIMQSDVLANTDRTNIPWVKLAIELLSLGIECPSIWDKVFSDDYLKTDLKRERRKRLLRILELYQYVKVLTKYDVDQKLDKKYLIEAKEVLDSVVEQPMQKFVEAAVGGPQFVFTKVRTRMGHIIDHVIAIDKKSLQIIRVPDFDKREDVFYDTIAVDTLRTHYIAIIPFPTRYYCINKPTLKGVYGLRLRAYEKMGIDVVVIEQSTWNELLYVGQITHIRDEVRLKMKYLLNMLQ